MNSLTIRGVIRRNLLAVFLIALLAGGGGFYVLLEHAAMDQAETEAQVMLSSAMSIRDYTNSHILPRLTAVQDATFHEETVPSFAAQTVLRGVAWKDHAYNYREAALNPTAPADRAVPFEVELIRQFRADTALKETRGTIDQNGQRLFYLARPIRIDDPQCLMCHDTPQDAPHAMLAKYGPNNGFGWKLHEIVGVQLVTVPVTQQFQVTLQLVAVLMGSLALIFAVAYFALSASLETTVVTPLSRLAEAADQASRSSVATPEVPGSGVHEIRRLAEAIQRLRVSLAKALSQLSQTKDGSHGQ
jgi:protein-histidine pros-kinase